jgi:hypothetical protein
VGVIALDHQPSGSLPSVSRRYPVHARYMATSQAFGLVFPGQGSVVSLPACQQRVLDGIERGLQTCEPRLASMFAIFTRLTRDEAVPQRESLRPGADLAGTWPGGGPTATLRAIVFIPLVLGFMALFVFLAMNSSIAHGCGPVAGLRAAAVAQVTNCQPAPALPGR